MPYIKVYSLAYDEVFQCEINEETAAKAIFTDSEVSKEPFPSIPIRSRLISEANKERDTE